MSNSSGSIAIAAQQVSHWIHDEEACVTVQRVLQTFDLSWEDASSLLKKIPEEGRNYSVTSFAASHHNSTPRRRQLTMRTTMLVKSKLGGDDSKDADSSVWYALALDGCTESIHTSHERDRSHFQEGIATVAVPPSLRGKAGSEGYSCSILVSEQLKNRIKSSGGAARANTEDDFCSDPMPSKAAFIRPVKKTATTAKSFFGNNKSSTTGGKTLAASSKTLAKQSAPSKVTTTTSSSSSRGKNATKPTQSSTLSFQPKKKETTQSTNKLSKKKNGSRDEEKENVLNISSTVGNADDFMGDVDDEDEEDDDVVVVLEEDRSEVKAQPTKGKAASEGDMPKKSARRAYQLEDDSDDESGSKDQIVEEEEEEKPKKKNAFTNDGTKQRRRRKRMVEKTYTDDQGYLHTETHSVWEDIPSDEEDISMKKMGAAKKAKKTAAPPKALKQGSLMGFFSKKT